MSVLFIVPLLVAVWTWACAKVVFKDLLWFFFNSIKSVSFTFGHHVFVPHFAHPITCIKPTLKAVRDGMRSYIVVGIGFNTVEHKCSMIVLKGPKATGRPGSASLQGKPQFWIAALLGPFGCSAFGEKFIQSIFVSESLTCSENNQSSYFLKKFSSA